MPPLACESLDRLSNACSACTGPGEPKLQRQLGKRLAKDNRVVISDGVCKRMCCTQCHDGTDTQGCSLHPSRGDTLAMTATSTAAAKHLSKRRLRGCLGRCRRVGSLTSCGSACSYPCSACPRVVPGHLARALSRWPSAFPSLLSPHLHILPLFTVTVCHWERTTIHRAEGQSRWGLMLDGFVGWGRRVPVLAALSATAASSGSGWCDAATAGVLYGGSQGLALLR